MFDSLKHRNFYAAPQSVPSLVAAFLEPAVAIAAYLAVLDWPQEAAQHYAEMRADLKKRGAQLGAADLMIAAHARAVGAIIVTNNVKDFGRVKGLQVENWAR